MLSRINALELCQSSFTCPSGPPARQSQTPRALPRQDKRKESWTRQPARAHPGPSGNFSLRKDSLARKLSIKMEGNKLRLALRLWERAPGGGSPVLPPSRNQEHPMTGREICREHAGRQGT